VHEKKTNTRATAPFFGWRFLFSFTCRHSPPPFPSPHHPQAPQPSHCIYQHHTHPAHKLGVCVAEDRLDGVEGAVAALALADLTHVGARVQDLAALLVPRPVVCMYISVLSFLISALVGAGGGAEWVQFKKVKHARVVQRERVAPTPAVVEQRLEGHGCLNV
jgi:hypothetical protein